MEKFKFEEIQDIEWIEKNEEVFDLTVEEDHSYTVEDYVVHNCITTSNTSVHFPMASLIEETKAIKDSIHGNCKIVADGGIRGYSDVIKALALGADYVMIGSVLSGLLGSSGEVTSDIPYQGLGYQEGAFYNEKFEKVTLTKRFYGMASRQGQIDMSGKKTKTSEGIEKTIQITAPIDVWVTNMRDYLKSAMSYVGAKTLNEFHPTLVVLSEGTKNTINR